MIRMTWSFTGSQCVCVCVCVCLSVCLSVYLSVCPSVSLSHCVHVCLCLSVCLPLSVSLPLCVCVYMYLHVHVSCNIARTYFCTGTHFLITQCTILSSMLNDYFPFPLFSASDTPKKSHSFDKRGSDTPSVSEVCST